MTIRVESSFCLREGISLYLLYIAYPTLATPKRMPLSVVFLVLRSMTLLPGRSGQHLNAAFNWVALAVSEKV